jgi:FO synthase
MREMIESAGRIPRQRTTLYADASPERIEAGLAAGVLTDIVNTPARKYERKRNGPLLRPGLIGAVEVD